MIIDKTGQFFLWPEPNRTPPPRPYRILFPTRLIKDEKKKKKKPQLIGGIDTDPSAQAKPH